ncbi:UNVERIFIED_CONTAM: hypothetical protein K2H54_053414, partial [Gekko kuhli]
MGRRAQHSMWLRSYGFPKSLRALLGSLSAPSSALQYRNREGKTGHTEVVRIVFDPQTISYEDLLKIFWESHDPTHDMRQHNDVGTQYRSAIYTFGPEQLESALKSKAVYEQ